MTTKSSRGRPVVDMTGERCGKLRVLSRQGTLENRLAAWRVECDCGNVFVAAGSHLRNGKTWRCRECYLEAKSGVTRTHGETNNYLYRTWLDIRSSARDPGKAANPTLTGRGCPVCLAWDLDYTIFAADVRRTIGDRPTILHNLVLIEGSKEFGPNTVRWAGRADWMRNFKRPNITFALILLRPEWFACI
jgi:hypothetical protein